VALADGREPINLASILIGNGAVDFAMLLFPHSSRWCPADDHDQAIPVVLQNGLYSEQRPQARSTDLSLRSDEASRTQALHHPTSSVCLIWVTCSVAPMSEVVQGKLRRPVRRDSLQSLDQVLRIRDVGTVPHKRNQSVQHWLTMRRYSRYYRLLSGYGARQSHLTRYEFLFV